MATGGSNKPITRHSVIRIIPYGTNAEGAYTAFGDNADNMLTEDEFFAQDEWTEWDASQDASLDETEWTY